MDSECSEPGQGRKAPELSCFASSGFLCWTQSITYLLTAEGWRRTGWLNTLLFFDISTPCLFRPWILQQANLHILCARTQASAWNLYGDNREKKEKRVPLCCILIDEATSEARIITHIKMEELRPKYIRHCDTCWSYLASKDTTELRSSMFYRVGLG